MPSLNPPNLTITDGVSRANAAFGAATDRWGARIVFVGVAFVYLLVYLVGIGDLWITAGPGPLTARGVANPLRMFALDGLGRFGAIGIVYLGGLGLTYLFSPLNLLSGLLVAGLAGANAALTYVGIRQPRGSRLGITTVVLAGILPIILLAAMIGPTVVFLTGMQGSYAVLMGLRLLVLICVFLLFGSILHMSRQIPRRT